MNVAIVNVRAAGRAFVCGSALVALAAAQQPLEVSGRLGDETVWSGAVRVTGDLEIARGSRLVIRPGTRVAIAERDGLQQGWDPQRIEWHVKGQLVVEGTATEPVILSPDPSDDGAFALGEGDLGAGMVRPTWHGVVIHDRSDEAQRRCSIRGAIFERAAAGVQIPANSPILEDCVFLGCGTGVEVGSAYKDQRFRGLRGGAAAPELQRCRFAGCGTGIYAEIAGAPVISNCVFYRCNTGLGPRRPGYTTHLQPPGCSVHASAFLDNGTGIVGCAIVFHSIFVGNRTALQLSAYHDVLATEIDRVMLRHCLVQSRDEDVVGDTGLVRDLLRGDPRFRGPLDVLGRRGPALPDALHLEDGSAAIGKADNGGDLGPMARPRLRDEPFAAEVTGRPVRTVLALQHDGKKSWRRQKDVAPGGEVGKSWWAVVPAAEEGAFDGRAAFGLEVEGVVLAFAFECDAAGTRTLRVNGDTAAVEVLCNGGEAGALTGRRRFARSGWGVELPVVAGRNEVLVQVDFWSTMPRLLLDLDGSWRPVDPAVGWSPAAAGEDASPLQWARGTRRGRGRDLFVDASFAVPLHWALAGRTDVVTLRAAGFGNRPQSVDVELDGPDKLRIGPLPGELSKQEVELAFPGLRDAAGRPVAVEPVTVKLR